MILKSIATICAGCGRLIYREAHVCPICGRPTVRTVKPEIDPDSPLLDEELVAA